ncbi:MAG: DUF2800 domain-containing protein [Nitrospiraceae bacterium]|nr:DUF2800 domain-containing protein [Nitrospiraceae bacterium]
MTEIIKTIRASFASIATFCSAAAQPSSAAAPPIRMAGDDAAALTGIAIHEVCEYIVKYGDRPDNLAGWLSTKGYGSVDADEIGFLSWYALKAWKGTKDWSGFQNAMSAPVTELEIQADRGPVRVTGHIDVSSVAAATALDWKSGYRTEVDVEPQMRIYAFLLSTKLPNVAPDTVITAAVVWLRDKTYQTWKWTVAEIQQWVDEMLAKLANEGDKFNAGDHCRYCPHYYSCPAQRAIVQSTIMSLANMTGEDDTAMATMAQIYPAVQNVERMVLAYRDRLRMAILKHGPILTGDGMAIILKESHRETIDALKSWETLASFFSDDVETIAGCMTVGKTKLLKAIADASPKGQKGKAKGKVMTELRTAGAISTATRTTLSFVREQEVVKETENDTGTDESATVAGQGAAREPSAEAASGENASD